jgi:hypothetical protein
MTIDFSQAMSNAIEHLKNLESRPNGVPYVLIQEKIRETPDGWYFPYQSLEFLNSGDFSKSLVGNWPLFVDRRGNISSGRPKPKD